MSHERIYEADPELRDEADQERETFDEASEIRRLAKLKRARPLAYARERKEAAKKLGCTVSLLDKLVDRKGGNGKNGNGNQGRPVEFLEIEAWPSPIDGAALLDGLATAIRRHVVMGSAEADATSLWVVASYQYMAFRVFPRLFITAAERESGKTTLLDVLVHVVPRPLFTSNISAAALFRVIDMYRPSMLIDEADSFAKDNEDLRNIINSGHSPDHPVIRTVGDSFEVRAFDVFSPMAIAAIGMLGGTVMNRSIIIRLRRRRLDEPIEALQLGESTLKQLARMAVRWTGDHADELTAAAREMPHGMINRLADNWRPLFAIAKVARGNWPRRLNEAALGIAAASQDETSTRIQLLSDLRALFTDRKTDRLSSEAVVEYLLSLEDRLWPEFGKQRKPITKVQVARVLKPLKITSVSTRLADGSTPKGYHREAFQNAFERYLAPEQPET